MATTTYELYNGDGSDKTFDYSFPTYTESEVVVEVNGVVVNNYTIPQYKTSGSNTVTFDNTTGTTNTDVCESDGSPKTGVDNVRIRRDTNVDSAKITYVAGTSIKAVDLNKNQTQVLRALQEEQNTKIDTLQIADDAITSAKIEDDAVTSALIADGTIVDGNISTSAEIGVNKLAHGTNNQILQSDNSGNVEWVTNVQLPGNLDVNTNTTVGGTLGVTGTTTAAAINASGAVGVDGDFDVNTNKFTVASSTGNTTVGGTLGVTGQITGNITGNVTGNVSGSAGSVTGNAATATALESARTIGGVSFDGTGNINLPGVNTAGNQDTSGNAATATALETARTIGGVSFNGTGNIDLPGVNTAGNQNTSGNAATATAISGVDATTDELNILDGVTANKDELNLLDGKSIVESISASSTNTQLPTALAVDTRITSLVTDVGGFRPIANETSFPATNPDPEDNAGTIVSIKALSQAFTTGSGVTTKVFTDGAGSGNDVTITGLTQSTTYPAGRGMLVETTSTLHTYAFHRLTLDETGVAAAQAAIDDWDERYYGPVGSDPSTRPGGGSRVQGDLYFNTTDNQMKVWNNAASQWDDVASSSSSSIVTFSPAFDSSETEFTASTVPVDAQSILISINGVIQKPNAGTSTPSEGYIKMANGKIKFATPPDTNSDYFAVSLGNTVSVGTPSPNTVGTTELKDNEVTEVKLKIHAAPSGTDKFLAYTSNGMEWAVPSYLSLANDANNRVVTGDGSGGLNAETNLTFDGDNLIITGSNHVTQILKAGGSTSDLAIDFKDSSDNLEARIFCASDTGDLRFYTGGANERLRITSDGNVGIGVSPSKKLHVKGTDVALRLESTEATGRIGMEFYDTSAQKGFFGYPSSGNDHMAIQQNEAADLYFYVNGAERTRINSSGQVLIGTTDPGNANADNFTIADSANCGITVRSGNTSTGNIYFSDATGASDAGQFAGAVEYAHDSNSLRLHTNGDERVRIESGGNLKIINGDLVIGTAGTGINFAASADGSGTVSSEVLDDYEEGTWTPTLNTGDFGVTSYSTRNGTYTRIGRAVHIRMYIMLSDKGSNSGNLKLWGLPFTNAASPSYTSLAVWSTSMEVPGARSVIAYVNPGSTWCAIQRYNDSNGDANWCTEAHLNNNSEIQLSGIYYV